MRGPRDEQIESQVSREGSQSGGTRSTLIRKVLLRELQLLESAGLTEAAKEVVYSAIRNDDLPQFEAESQQFTAAPSGASAVPDVTGPAQSDGQQAAVSLESIGRTYMAAADQMGVPDQTKPLWKSIGPTTIPGGQTYGSSRVNVSGRISSVAVDPSNPAHVLVGAAHGGVWETFDRGNSWAPRTDYASTLTVGALAFDPRNNRTVYCGTGEGDWWSYLGAGILRSSDGGTSWSSLCTTPFVGQGFYDLLVHPTTAGLILAATTNGLYRSTDSGSTWSLRRSMRTWSLAFASTGGATTEILAGCQDGLYRSTDGGITWTVVSLPGGASSYARLHTDLALSSSGVAYAWGASGSKAYLWRRSGTTWTSVSTPPGVNVGQAWYDWFLAIAPDRENEIYCGAIEVHKGTLSGSTWSWQNITNKGSSGDSIHPDQHNIAFEPGRPDTLYVANDGGLYRSDNRGVNWTHCNRGLVITEFEYIAQDLGSSRWVIGGTQDNGTQRWTGGSEHEHIADGDGGDCAVNRSNPNTVFHTYYNMSPERSTSKGNAGSWSYIPPPIPSGEGSLFYPPFEASANDGNTIAIGGDALYVSRENGSNWTRLAFPTAARSSAMFIPSANTVYVGTTDGRIYRSQWTGSAWGALVALSQPRAGAFLSDLYVNPSNPQCIWVTSRTVGGGRVFVSNNGGTSWTDRSAGLPSLPINAIEIHPGNPNRLWVAADLGVYESTDGGASWHDFSNGMPHMYVADLVYHPHARVLRAATRSRGLWEIPVDGWLSSPLCGVQFNGSLNANASGRWFTFNWPATWHVIWTVMPTIPATAGGPQLTWTVQVERANPEMLTYWINIQNLTGNSVNFEGRYCILNYY